MLGLWITDAKARGTQAVDVIKSGAVDKNEAGGIYEYIDFMLVKNLIVRLPSTKSHRILHAGATAAFNSNA